MQLTEALERYLGARPSRYQGVPGTEPTEIDLVEAAILAGDWRRNGPAATAAILYALHLDHKYSLRALEDLTQIPMKSCDRLIHAHDASEGGEL